MLLHNIICGVDAALFAAAASCLLFALVLGSQTKDDPERERTAWNAFIVGLAIAVAFCGLLGFLVASDHDADHALQSAQTANWNSATAVNKANEAYVRGLTQRAQEDN